MGSIFPTQPLPYPPRPCAVSIDHPCSGGAFTKHLVTVHGLRSGDSLARVTCTLPPGLDMLALEGAMVPIDAIGCQTGIAERIVALNTLAFLMAVSERRCLPADIPAATQKPLRPLPYPLLDVNGHRCTRGVTKLLQNAVSAVQ